MVTFDGESRRITVGPGTASLSVGAGLYSAWKEWAALNPQFLAAFRTFGGDPTAAGQSAPAYFFLTNGWRVVVENLNLVVTGNLYTDEGASPFIATNSTITHRTSDAATVATSGATGPSTAEIVTALRPDLAVINDGVKRASLLVPHLDDLP